MKRISRKLENAFFLWLMALMMLAMFCDMLTRNVPEWRTVIPFKYSQGRNWFSRESAHA